MSSNMTLAPTGIELGPRPNYNTEDFISRQIKEHCKASGIPVDPIEAQKVVDYLGNDPNYIYDTSLHTEMRSYFYGDHALIRLIDALHGVYFTDAKETASALGVTLVTREERGVCMTLWENHVTVSLDDDGCIEGIEGYG